MSRSNVSNRAGIVHDADGNRWERASDSATADHLNDVVFNGAHAVAVGWNGTIVVSP